MVFTKGKKFCINCGRLIPENQNECNNCGHDQRVPIVKKTTSAQEMVRALIAFARPDRTYSNYVEDFGIASLDQSIKDGVFTEILFLQLTIGYYLCFLGIQRDSIKKKFAYYFTIDAEQHLRALYGEEQGQEVWNTYQNRHTEYIQVFQGNDYVRSLTDLFQHHIESAILGVPLPPEMQIPDIRLSTTCFVYVSNLFPPLQTFINKWKIQ
jgi:hypothetical protein